MACEMAMKDCVVIANKLIDANSDNFSRRKQSPSKAPMDGAGCTGPHPLLHDRRDDVRTDGAVAFTDRKARPRFERDRLVELDRSRVGLHDATTARTVPGAASATLAELLRLWRQ